MKRLTIQALLLATLAAQPMLAQADHDRFDRNDRFDISALQWRLGPDYGRGHEILFRAPGERRWQRAPGAAVDVGDGWVIGTDRRSGGFGIYRWNGRDWQRMPGAAVEIGGSYREPWVVNDRGERFQWSGSNWRQVRGIGRRDQRDRNDYRQSFRDDDRGDWQDRDDYRGERGDRDWNDR